MKPHLADPLGYLIAPLRADEFLRDFGKRPIFIKGRADKFSPLFNRSRYERVVARIPYHETVITAAFPNTRNNETTILPFQANAVYRAGATVCVCGIDRHDPMLAQFVGRLRGQVRYAGLVGINCYASPDGTGFGTHFDARIATTLQISGRKRWRFSRRPAVSTPRTNVQLDENRKPRVKSWKLSATVEAPNEADFDEALLEPGDVLSLPAGCWHEAAAEGHSLALNLYFEPRGFIARVLEILEQRICDADPRWRDAPPIVVGDATDSALPEAVRAHVSELLAVLKREVSALSADDGSMHDAWRAAITETRTAEDERRDDHPIEADDELIVRHEVPFSVCRRIDGEGDVLELYVAGTVLALAGDSADFIRELQRRERFVAHEAAEWARGYAWPEARALLTELLALGVLGRADETGLGGPPDR